MFLFFLFFFIFLVVYCMLLFSPNKVTLKYSQNNQLDAMCLITTNKKMCKTHTRILVSCHLKGYSFKASSYLVFVLTFFFFFLVLLVFVLFLFFHLFQGRNLARSKHIPPQLNASRQSFLSRAQPGFHSSISAL